MDVVAPYGFICLLLFVGGMFSYVLGIGVAWTVHRYLVPFLRAFLKG